MGFRALVLIGTLFSVSLASAQQESAAPAASDSSAGALQSEYLHQAPGGKFEVSPGIRVESERYELKNTPTDVNIFKLPLTAKAEYGISDMFSVSAVLGYGIGGTSYEDCPSGNVCDDKKARGMIDPVISANLRVPMGMGALRAGLDFSFALEDAKSEADGDGNFATGGTVFTPYVGYEMVVGSNVFGAKLSYEAIKGDRTHKDESSTPTSTDKVSEGEELKIAGFYEYHFPRIFTVAGAIEFSDRPETKSSTNGGVKSDDNNGVKTLKFKIYAPMKFNETVTLIPTIVSGVLDNENDSNIDSSTYAEAGVQARFTF